VAFITARNCTLIMAPLSGLTMALQLLSIAFFGHVSGVVALATIPQDSRRGFLSEQAATTMMGILGGSSLLSQVEPASAYERRDVGDENRSATTAAFNEQAYQTNNRLEREGLKLDTREEEQAKLRDAMTSFSYESSVPQRKSGYNTTPSTRTATASSKSLLQE
jgi:hypothetical protein